MNARKISAVSLAAALVIAVAVAGRHSGAQDKAAPAAPARAIEASQADMKAIAEAGKQVAKLFNAGQAEQLAALFLPQGELVDEDGNSFRGTEEIQGLLAKYFEKYPGAQLVSQADTLCLTGPVAIEEGKRVFSTKEAGDAECQYVTVWARTAEGWKIASTREVAVNDSPPAHDHLQPLSWLIGDWVNEGSDSVVSIHYRWSEDKNFLLGSFLVTSAGEVTMKSEQRIAWDPQAESFRSWLFDSDGGFSEGAWSETDDGWEIKSSAVLPDGSAGSATIRIAFQGQDRFTIQGKDRRVGGSRSEDFAVTVTRKAPAPAKAKAQ